MNSEIIEKINKIITDYTDYNISLATATQRLTDLTYCDSNLSFLVGDEEKFILLKSSRDPTYEDSSYVYDDYYESSY